MTEGLRRFVAGRTVSKGHQRLCDAERHSVPSTAFAIDATCDPNRMQIDLVTGSTVLADILQFNPKRV